MIDKRILEIVLTEQKREITDKKKIHFCYRKEEELINLQSNKAQVVIGVRRSGKSTMCFNVLNRAGVKFAYVNFDDERFLDVTASDLNDILEVLYKINGEFTHLFLDEAQNVSGWHLFVNRLLRQGLKIIITGSNAKLLSSELSTHLTGRHSTIELFPFSFYEYCIYKNIDIRSLTTIDEAFRREAFDNYLRTGGFPEVLIYGDEKRYISGLVSDILNRDIKNRYRIRYFAIFERLAHHLMNISPTIVSAEDLSLTLGIKSELTVKNYIKYLVSAYLLLSLSKFSTKSKQRIRNNKVYTVDVSIMNNHIDAFSGENIGWRLETTVFLQLIRMSKLQGFDIYYYKKSSRSKEVDFVVCKDNKILQLYQVAYDISNPKTKKREIDSLLEASKETGCQQLYLITDHERAIVNNDGCTINIIPAYEWLLSFDDIARDAL